MSDLTGAETEVIAIAETFARDVVVPNAARWELDRAMPADLIPLAAEAGLCGLLAPPERGGRGLGPRAMAGVVGALAAADLAAAFSVVVHNNHVGSISKFGSDAHKDRYLPDLISGRRVGAFLLTEPGVGSDAAAITTRAEPSGDGWVINGEKAWITNTTHADLLSVYAQTDPSLGHRGIAAFLIDASTPGVIRSAPYELMGGHAMGTGGFSFDDCRVDADAMFIPPGKGFGAAMSGIDIARAMVAAMCCGMLSTGLDTAVDYTMNREAFGQATSEFQGLRWSLADVATDLEAGRLLRDKAVDLLNDGADARLAAAHAKKFVTRATETGLAACMQAMGANGYRHEYPLARHLAAARLSHYIDGTTEIQNVVIARKLFAGTGTHE